MTGTGQKVGYIRVSSIEQNTESQNVMLNKIGMDKIFEEKISGKNTDRPQLQAMLEYVREGDTVYVKDLSRLARNTKDLLEIVEDFDNRGIILKSLKESIDTSTAFGKLILTFLGAIYQFERDNLKERQEIGIAIAKQKGKYKGRKAVSVPNIGTYYDKYMRRKGTKVSIAHELGISRTTLDKLFREYERSSDGN